MNKYIYTIVFFIVSCSNYEHSDSTVKHEIPQNEKKIVKNTDNNSIETNFRSSYEPVDKVIRRLIKTTTIDNVEGLWYDSFYNFIKK